MPRINVVIGHYGVYDYCASTDWLHLSKFWGETFIECQGELLELDLEAQSYWSPAAHLSSLLVETRRLTLFSLLEDVFPKTQEAKGCPHLHNPGKNSDGSDMGHVFTHQSISLSGGEYQTAMPGFTVPNPGPLLETWKGDQDSGTITKVTTGPTRDYPSLDVVCACFGQHEKTWSWKPCSCVNTRKFLKLYKPWCPHIKMRVIISLSLVCYD